MDVDTSKWSGEGEFTQLLVDRLSAIDAIAFVRVEDAPATRSEADYNFISNEIYVAFAMATKREPVRRLWLFSGSRLVSEARMNVAGLEQALASIPEVGAPDYSDAGMLQYLRSQRIVPPYQTRGYKLVELVRVYEAGAQPRG